MKTATLFICNLKTNGIYMYVYVLSSDKDDNVVLPETIKLDGILLNKKSKVLLLDKPSIKVNLTTINGIPVLKIPAQVKYSLQYAAVFKVQRSL
jgi:hypothetical protein